MKNFYFSLALLGAIFITYASTVDAQTNRSHLSKSAPVTEVRVAKVPPAPGKEGTGIVVEPAILYSETGEVVGYVNITYLYEKKILKGVRLIRRDVKGELYDPAGVTPDRAEKRK